MSCRNLSRFAAGALAVAFFTTALPAFNVSGQRWVSGAVTMHLQLGAPPQPLLDGETTWGAAAEKALLAWNTNLTNIRYNIVRDSTAPIVRGPDLRNAIANNVFFSSTVYGAAWDSRTLGITLSTYDTRTQRYSEADVLFNSTVQWDCYRGPVRSAPNGATLNDFRRVAIHEFGHALGLNHPDDIGQSVVAIMNAVTSDIDALALDDIAGARSIYDNPNVKPLAILNFQGTAGYKVDNNVLTFEVGTIRNDGEGASGAIRLELWATTQRFTTTLPAGSRNLGTYAFSSTLAPNSSLTNVSVSTPYIDPPNGSYYVFMILTEASGASFAIRDSIEFSPPLNVGPPTAPAIFAQPASVGGTAGAAATFTVSATGTLPLSYQWRKDGTNLPGATTPSLTIANVQPASIGAYSVVVTNSLGSATSNPASLILGNAANPGRIVNMSIRTNAGVGDNTLIVGVGLGGAGTSGSKAVLFRAVGPTLGAFGVGGALTDSVLTIYRGTAQFAENDDWNGGFDFSAVGAFGFSGTAPRDSAFYNSAIASGSYSIQITGKNNGTGVALAEVYDATPASAFTRTTPRLVNVSARTEVGTGDNILIAGFVVGGTTPVRVLVRAVGPTLGAFGVTGTLGDPRLEILSGTSRVAENDNWLAADAPTFASVGAFGLNANSRDAALVTTLVPGSYTAQISGTGGTTGVALVEVYELP